MSNVNVQGLSRGSSDQPIEPTTTNIPQPRRRWLLRLGVPLVFLVGVSALMASSIKEAFWPPKSVRVAPVIAKRDVEAAPTGGVIVQAPGWVEADPFPTAVSALTDGVVADVLVLEGERVDKDQVVARLIDDDAKLGLEFAESVLAEKQAALAAAEALRAEAQDNWDHPVELLRKRDMAAAMLAEKQAELDRWPAELAREEARLVYLKAEYDRVAPLAKGGHASSIEVLRVKQDYESQKSEVEVIRGQKPVLEAQIQGLQAELDAAAHDLQLRIKDTRALAEAKAAFINAEAAVRTATVQRDEAALRLRRMEVRAPVAGIVMMRLVEPGSKLMLNSDRPQSAHVLRLYDPERLQVRVDIPLVEAAKVGVGQPAEVIVDVLPERVFQGRLSRVVHEADVQKNTLQVKVAIEDPSPELKPEMLARARFLAINEPSDDEADSATRLFVPESALVKSEGQTQVFVINQADSTARLQTVELGSGKLEGNIEITNGLRPGDRVIVDPPMDLNDGDRIEPREA